MPIYKPSELMHFLAELGVHPKKALSQNFLLDKNIWEKILNTAEVKAGETVLEIGPGPGSLTELLLERGTEVIAVELDRAFAGALERFQTEDKRLTVHCQDILKFPLPDDRGQLKVLSNLPFHIAAPILTELAPQRDKVHSITAIVQEEMARRVTAVPGTKEFNSLAVFLQFYAEVHYCFPVSKNCFYPKPKVQSAVIQVVPKPPQYTVEEKAFFTLVRTAFSQRRKKLTTSLERLYPQERLKEVLKETPNARPEEFSLEQFVRLYQNLHS